MTTTAEDHEAIASVVQLYIDGSATGDATKLEQAFHSDARMFGGAGGQRMDIPIQQLFEMVAAMPMDANGSYKANIQSIEQVGDAATAVLAEDGCWGSASFVDFFSLARIDGEWKIVNKTFAHTGGELPG